MNKIICYPKINIGLNFDLNNTYKNKHSIKSIFFLYSKKWFDEIYIEENNSDQIEYFDSNKSQLHIENCLIKKTLLYLRTNNLLNNKYFKIKVIKNIPIAAGLGAGSSDAGNLIFYLTSNGYIDKQKLNYFDIAINLGSDIPFFISNYKYALVENFGDKITPLKINTKLKIDVYYPNIKINTKTIFDHLNLMKNNLSNNFEQIIDCFNNNLICKNIYNDLQCISFQLFNDFVIMSGSGSSLIMINKQQKIRTRYAPSPTGYFHIGGARTALFNYLFAKHNNGDFILRIEDTDVERNVEGGIDSQLLNLEWMGLTPDESIKNPKEHGPYIQSQKLDRYKFLANQLLNEKKAYYCFCTESELKNERENALKNHLTPKYSRKCLHLSQEQIHQNLQKNIPFTIRLKIDDNITYTWNDIVRGKIEVPSSAMTDPVILKSNGIAMYNFAVVIDDYDMEITHVLRGEEHISNTPYQLAIKKALNFNNDIQYGHLSIVIDETGKKLSKRNSTLKQFIEDYKNMGFIPSAIDNFLALLGWSPIDSKEILSLDELIKNFEINNLSKSPTYFDFNKLLWLGNEYFKKMSENEYLLFVKPFIDQSILTNNLISNLDMLLLIFKNQISYASQLNTLINDQFLSNHELNSNEIEIINNNLDVVDLFDENISKLSIFNVDNIIDIINKVKNITNKKGKDLFMPIRLVSTNLAHGPELAKTIFLLGKEKILLNIKHNKERR